MIEYQRYTQKEVMEFLRYGFMQPEEVDYYQKSRGREVSVLAINPDILHSNYRKNLLRERVYRGGMYLQRNEPTCMPWSVANALAVSGLRPDPSIMADMLNYAIKPHPEYGLSFGYANQIVDSFKARSFNFVEADLHLTPTIGMPTWKVEQAVWENAAIIRKLASRGGILTSVEYSWYTRGKEEGSHAICIAGFRTFRNGGTLVQVLDAGRCKLWVTVEHLSQSLDSEETYVVRPRFALDN